jgi:hypothetical protein
MRRTRISCPSARTRKFVRLAAIQVMVLGVGYTQAAKLSGVSLATLFE